MIHLIYMHLIHLVCQTFASFCTAFLPCLGPVPDLKQSASLLSIFLRASFLPFLVPQVDKLLKKYDGRYEEMFQKLDAKYTKTDSRRKVGKRGREGGVLIICLPQSFEH